MHADRWRAWTAGIVVCVMVLAGCGAEPAPPPPQESVASAPQPDNGTARPSPARAPKARPASKTAPAKAAATPSPNDNPVQPSKSEPPKPWMTLKQDHQAFAFDPQTGTLAAISDQDVTLYPRAYLEGKDDKVVGPTGVARGLRDVAFKRCGEKLYLVMLSTSDRRIMICDGTTLAPVRAVESPGATCTALAAPTDPAVHAVYAGSGQGVLKLDLDTFEITARQSRLQPPIACSSDGRTVYGSSHSTIRRWSVEPPPGRPDVQTLDRLPLPITVDPRGEYVAFGPRLFVARSQQEQTQLGGPVACFFTKRPVVVTLRGELLTALSLNNFLEYGSTTLPEGFLDFTGLDRRARSRLRRPTPPTPSVFADDAGDQVIVAIRNRLMRMPLSLMKVTDEPWLDFDLDLPGRVSVGQEVAAKVERPADSAKDPVAIVAGPEGAAVEDGTIKWTPSPAQVGKVRLTLRLSHGKLSKDRTFATQVARPDVDLGFTPDRAAVGPDGKYAVLWTRGTLGTNGRVVRSHMAVIDMARGEALVKRLLLYGVQDAAVGPDAVYLVTDYSRRLYALSPKDLDTTGEADLDFLPARLSTLSAKVLEVGTAPVGASRFRPRQQQEQRGQAFLRLPDLKPIAAIDRMRDARREARDTWFVEGFRGGRRPAQDVPTACGRWDGGFYAAGVLFGEDMDSARMPFALKDLPLLPLDKPRTLHPPSRRGLPAPHSGRPAPPAGEVLAGRGPEFMPDVWARAMLRFQPNGQQGGSASLAFDALDGVKEALVVPLFTNDGQMEKDLGPKPGTSFLAPGRGRSVLAVLGRRAFVVHLDKGQASRFGAPPHFLPFDKPVLLGDDATTTIAHTVKGGAAPLRYVLQTTCPGATLDASTGVLTLDRATLMKSAVMQAVREVKIPVIRRGADGSPRQVDPAPRLAALQRLTAVPFRFVTGKDPAGVVVALPVSVAIADARDQADELEYLILIDVPLEAIRQELEKDKPPAGNVAAAPGMHS